MPQATYDVQKGAPPSPADTSFRSCLLAIIIVIFLSLLLIFLAVGLRHTRSPEPRRGHVTSEKEIEDVNEKGRYDEHKSNDDIETLTTTSSSKPTTRAEQPTTSTPEPTVRRTNDSSGVDLPPVTETSTISHESTVVNTTEPHSTTLLETPTVKADPTITKTVTQTTTTAATTTTTTTTHSILSNETSTSSTFYTNLTTVSPTHDSPLVTVPSSASEVSSSTASLNTTESSTVESRSSNHTQSSLLVTGSQTTSSTTIQNITDQSKSPDGGVTLSPSTTVADEPLIHAVYDNSSDLERSGMYHISSSSEPPSTVTTQVKDVTSTSSKSDDQLLTRQNDTLMTTPVNDEDHLSSWSKGAWTGTVLDLTSEYSTTVTDVSSRSGAMVAFAKTDSASTSGAPEMTGSPNLTTGAVISSTTLSNDTDAMLHAARTRSVISDAWTTLETTVTSNTADTVNVTSSSTLSNDTDAILHAARTRSGVSDAWTTLETTVPSNTAATVNVTSSSTLSNDTDALLHAARTRSGVSDTWTTLETTVTSNTADIVNVTSSSTHSNDTDAMLHAARTRYGVSDAWTILETTVTSNTANTVNVTSSTKLSNDTDAMLHKARMRSGVSDAWTTLETTVTSDTADTVNDTVKDTNLLSTTPTSQSSPVHLLPTDSTVPEKKVCQTAECYEQAQNMVAMMNHTVNPCRHFYLTACGNLQKNEQLLPHNPFSDAFHRIAGEMSSDKELPTALKKLQQFQESCMQYDTHMPDRASRLAEVRKILDSIGNFSIEDAEWTIFRSKFTDLFSTLIRYNSSPLFDVMLDVESKNNPKFVFKLVPPLHGASIFSGDQIGDHCRSSTIQKYNEAFTDMTEKYKAYEQCKQDADIFRDTEALVEELGYLTFADEDINKNFSRSLAFSLIDLHDYLKEAPKKAVVHNQQITKQYTSTTVAELDKKFPLVHWNILLAKLVGVNSDTIANDTVQVYSFDFLSYMFENIEYRAKTEHRFAKDLNNALLAFTAQKLTEDFVKQYKCNYAAYCQYVAYNLMSQAASSAYLRSFPDSDLNRMQNRANVTFVHLKDTLHSEFQEAKWLDEESKTELFEQLQQIQLAPYNWESFLLNDTYLNDYYDEFDVNTTNYIQNAVNLIMLDKKHAFSLYQKDAHQPEHIWSHFKHPYQSEAIVIYALNMVVIPVGLLSKFSNDASLPKYINMAGEGFVIAHELAHMFDFVGMKKDLQRNHLKLNSHSAMAFQDLEFCFQNVYNFQASHEAEDGKHINFQTLGELSANERMADYTGMLIAYNTYKRVWGNSSELLPFLTEWTADQLFFLQAAQDLCSKETIYHHFIEIFENEHLPSAIRANNIVSNSEEFSMVFDCPKRSHCEVFPRLSEAELPLKIN